MTQVNPMTPAELAEIAARAEAAREVHLDDDKSPGRRWALIDISLGDIPRLLAEVERLQQDATLAATAKRYDEFYRRAESYFTLLRDPTATLEAIALAEAALDEDSGAFSSDPLFPALARAAKEKQREDAARIAALAAENARLRDAERIALPRTADGEAIRVGSVYWFLWEDDREGHFSEYGVVIITTIQFCIADVFVFADCYDNPNGCTEEQRPSAFFLVHPHTNQSATEARAAIDAAKEST